MQRIEVKNFGPLKDVTLDIKDYMVFIGPQASGKSTLAKLIYFYLKIGEIYSDTHIAVIFESDAKKKSDNLIFLNHFSLSIKTEFIKIFPSFENGMIDFIYDENHKICINVLDLVQNRSDGITISEGFNTEVNDFENQVKDLSIDKNISEFFYQKMIDYYYKFWRTKKQSSNNILYSSFNNEPSISNVFIPAGRTIISILSNSIALIENNNLDYFNENFIKLTNTIRKFIDTTGYENYFGRVARLNSNDCHDNIFALANDLAFKIIKGDFNISGIGDEILHYNNINNVGYAIPLKYTSSGQQEASWLINTVHYLLTVTGSDTNYKEYSTIIEEPETHLFPEAQRDMTYLITLLANQPAGQVVITTHSPYTLAALNNLVKAHIIGSDESNQEAVAAIVNPLLWIDPKRIFVGYLDETGLKDIVDKETNLISHEELDGVSVDIMSKFDDLLEIQYDG